MTHLGQRLSALIDGELDGSERERVLLHISKCGSCREEAAALRMLKRRMSALGESASGVGAGLTGRLMGLSAVASFGDQDGAEVPQAPARLDQAGRGPASPEQRVSRYFLAGSLVVFLAGLGTAAFIAGGETQPQAPQAPLTPSVDVVVFPHQTSGSGGASRPAPGPASVRPQVAVRTPHPARTGA